MDESRLRVGYYAREKESTMTPDTPEKRPNTGHGSHTITTARHTRSVAVVGRSRRNDDGGLKKDGKLSKLFLVPDVYEDMTHHTHSIHTAQATPFREAAGATLIDSTLIRHAPSLLRVLRTGTAPPDPAWRHDRSRGVLLGLAVGNILGLRGEGLWYYEIPGRYPGGVIAPNPKEQHRPMDDDLAQAVELSETLRVGGDIIHEFARRLVVWRRENGRGIGYTTRTAIDFLEAGAPPPEAARMVYEHDPIASNGGLMRCAPIAIAHQSAPERLVRDSAALCTVTHYAPTSQWSCIIINAVIALLLQGADPDVSAVLAAVSADGAPDLLATAADDGIPTEVLTSLAEGQPISADAAWLRCDQHLIGHTLLTMQAGLWAATPPLDFEAALVQLVSAGGDTDTNGAVAGAVLGARYGAAAIPQAWLDCIPERQRLEALADDLAGLSASAH